MTDDDPCGYDGTLSGDPCRQPAGEDGYCWLHPDKDHDNGRPTKLDKDVVDAITTRIAEGKSDASAFRQSGLHPSTKGNWLGKIDTPDDVPADPEFDADPYGYFFRRYERARGLGENWYVETVMEMAAEEGDLETLMAMLKQRYPESWGDVDRGEQAGGVVVNLDDAEEFAVDPETLEVVDE